MQRRGAANRLTGAIVLGEELAGALDAAGAGRNLGLVLARHPHRAGGSVELGGLDVTAAGHAVDVGGLLRRTGGSGACRGLALTFGQLLLAFHPPSLLRLQGQE